MALPSWGQIKRDSTYIEKEKNMWAGLSISERNTSLALNTEWYYFQDKDLTFKPNSPKQTGFVLGYKNVGLNISFEKGSIKDTADFGTTKQFSLAGSFVKPRSVFEASYNTYKGMYSKKNAIRPDLKTEAFDLQYFYVFNPTQYSYKAAFSIGENQLKPATSWLLFASTSWYSVRTDSSLYSRGHKELAYNINSLMRRSIGVGAGGAFSFVQDKFGMYVLGALALKVQNGRHTLVDVPGHEKDKIRVGPNSNLKASMAYNSSYFTARLVFDNTYEVYKVRDIFVTHGNLSMYFVVILKFQGPKFLERIKLRR